MTETDSPSGSEALLEQDTLLFGAGVVSDSEGVVTLGARFPTVTELDLLSVPPLLSEVDATQAIESAGLIE